MIDVLWVLVGIFIGSIGGILTISLLTAGKTEDLYMEIEDLRNQRRLLKEEILRLSKPTPKKKRKYKPRNKKK
jgi:hypothetical protein|tara:strand:+ start:305 stop:523 length:219 start_codon:yes stop_codon:yes gene_type:complete